MYVSMADTLAALHAVDPAAVGLGDFGRAGNYFARQVARWTRQWQMSRTREDAAIERLIAWLPANLPDDDRSGISHGDYRIGNLMFHAVAAAGDRHSRLGTVDARPSAGRSRS